MVPPFVPLAGFFPEDFFKLLAQHLVLALALFGGYYAKVDHSGGYLFALS